MADSTRDILLKIAAKAEFKELRDLNAELKESINTVARLRSMLKGNVGGAGLKGMAVEAQAAGKGVRGLKGEFIAASKEAEDLAVEVTRTGKLLKSTSRTFYRESGKVTKGSDVYQLPSGDEKVVKTQDGVVTAIEARNLARKKENEAIKAQRELGARWAREIDQQESEKLASQKKYGALRAKEIDASIAQERKQKKGLEYADTRQQNLERAEYLRRQNEAIKAQRELDRGDTGASMASKVAMWTLATAAVYGTIRAIKSGVTAFAELEEGTISLARVGRGFGSRQEEISAGARNVTSELLRLAVQYGATASEAQTAAVTFARLGLSQRDTIEAVRTSMLAANVANIGLVESATMLASAMQQFGMSVKDLPDMLNKLNTLENTTKTTTNDMLQAISRTGGVWREMGGGLEELAASVAVVQQATSRTGPEIGNAFKTIASRLLDAKTQADLFKKAGIDVEDVAGSIKPIGDVLSELVVKFQTMSEAERAQLTTQMAGIRQRNILQAQLDNYFQIQAQVIRQYAETGSAEKENAMVMETLTKKLESLMASFTNFAQTVGDSVLGGALKKLVGVLTTTVSALTSMGTIGVVLVGSLAAYAVSVVYAATKTTMLGATFKALWGGVQAVNAAILNSVGVTNAAVAANARLSASNLSTAKTYNVLAGSATGSWSVGAAKTGMLASALPYGVAALVGYGVIKGMNAISASGSMYDSEAGSEKISAGDKAVVAAQNRAKALKEQIKFAETAAQALEKIEERERNGQRLSAEQLKTRADINRFARESLPLTSREASATYRLTLNSRELLAVKERLARSGASGSSVISLLESQAETVSKELEKAKVEAGYYQGAKGEGGFFSWYGKQMGTWSEQDISKSKGTVSTLEAKLADIKNQIKAEKDAAEKDAAMEVKKLEEKGPGGQALIKELEELDKSLKKLSDHENALADVLNPDALTRATAELAIARKEVEALEKSAAYQWGDEDQKKKLMEPRQDAVQKAQTKVEIENLRDRATKAKEVMDLSIEQRRNFVKQYAEIGAPEEYRGMAGAKAQYEETMRMKNQLQSALGASQAADAFTADGRYARPGDVEYDTKVTNELNMRLKIAELEKQALRDQANIESERLSYAVKTTEQMKQQYETARKKFGGMSDVDMARARITAGRFKRGELGQLGQEAWNLPSEIRSHLVGMEETFPGMRIMPELGGTPQDWFTRKERQVDKDWNPQKMFEQKFQEAGQALSITMNIGDAENKIDALGNSLIAYLSTNIGQLWDELIARTDAAAKPPAVKRVQGVVR